MSLSNKWIILVLLMLFPWTAPLAQESGEEVIKVDVALVTVNVSVTDGRGRYVSDLQSEDFLISDEGSPVSLAFFDRLGPTSIVFVIDTSSSMKYQKWKKLRAGLKKFLARAREGDDFTLITFSDSPKLIVQSVGGDELWRAFGELTPEGETALYDGMLLGLDALAKAHQRHKALVLISDGQDTRSRGQLEDVQREIVAHPATVYTVGILPRELDWHEEQRHGREILKQLAVSTGGLTKFPNPEEISEVLEDISADTSNQYVLSYYPPVKAQGWRRVRVNVHQGPRPLKLRYQERYLMR